MADYIPGSDSAFTEWEKNFVSYLGTHLAQLGLTLEDVTPLTDEKPIWEGKLLDHTQAQAASQAARAAKDEQRAIYEGMIRALTARIQAYPGTTDADRLALGITVRSSAQVPTGTLPEDRPVAFISLAQRMKHTLRVENSTDMGASKAKPSWAFGCEIWRKVGTPPASDGSDLEYVGVMTRNPTEVSYSTEDEGKTAYYMLRWVSKKGVRGGWSETESATIAA